MACKLFALLNYKYVNILFNRSWQIFVLIDACLEDCLNVFLLPHSWHSFELLVAESHCALFQVLSEYSGLADSLGLPGLITSSKTGSNVGHVFELCTNAALDRSNVSTVLRKVLPDASSDRSSCHKVL